MGLSHDRKDPQPWPFGWWVALAAALQLGLFAALAWRGLAGTSDSVIYVHAAGTLRGAARLLNPDGSAYRFWPPLYPLLLALGNGAGAAVVLHAVSLGASLVGWGWLGHRLLPRSLAVALLFALALSTPWLVVSKFLWGETVFLALFAGYALGLYQWLATRRIGGWALATAVGALLPLHRTAGFFILMGAAAGLLLSRKQPNSLPRLALAGHFVLVLLGGMAWHIYALLVAAPSVYRLNRGWTQFFNSAADYGFVLSRWVLPVRAAWRPDVPIVWALALVAALVVMYPQQHSITPGAERGLLPAAGAQRTFLLVMWSILVSFILTLLISTTFTRSASGLYDAERYASVLYGPALVLLFERGSRAWAAANGAELRSRKQWLLLGLLGCWLAYAAGRGISNVLALQPTATLSWPAEGK